MKSLKESVVLLFVIWAFTIQNASAQNNAITQYNQFKQQARQEYIDFRNKCNKDYAEFLRQAWQSYEQGPIIPLPEEEPLPPVVMPEEDIENPIDYRPLPIDTVVTPIKEEPQPKPIAPIYENATPLENTVSFVFFGTEGKVRVPQMTNALSAINSRITEEQVAQEWESLSNGDYDNLVRDCLEMRIRFKLSDWAYLLMLRELSEKYCGGHNNAATLLMGWIYCQTGYQMRFGMDNKTLYLLAELKTT